MGRPGVRLSLFDYMNYSENMIKGRIAETIVSEMFREAGYFVYRFGYEGILQNFTQRDLLRMKKESYEAEKVSTMPDFIIMDKEGAVSFIEVKYCGTRETEQKIDIWLEKAVKYWPEARLLIVRPSEPYFTISTIASIVKSKNICRLEKYRSLPIAKNVIEMYAELVKRYF